jgi:hypothetical protein
LLTAVSSLERKTAGRIIKIVLVVCAINHRNKPNKQVSE